MAEVCLASARPQAPSQEKGSRNSEGKEEEMGVKKGWEKGGKRQGEKREGERRRGKGGEEKSQGGKGEKRREGK